jgi:hypothetical protein
MPPEQPVDSSPKRSTKSDAPRRVLTEFDWVVYADATFAGLSILIPIPFVDALFEEYFRRRMPRDIARRRGRTLSPAVMRVVNRRRGKGFLSGCLMLPFDLIIYVLRNLYRTIVYVLSVYDASEKLSYYWHRAFLLDYSIGRGHLDNTERAVVAGEAVQRVLETTRTSPMLNLAGQIIETARHQIRGLLRAIYRFIRRKEETAGVKRTRTTIAEQWAEFTDYLLELADRYDATYATVERERQLAAAQSTRPT